MNGEVRCTRSTWQGCSTAEARRYASVGLDGVPSWTWLPSGTTVLLLETVPRLWNGDTYGSVVVLDPTGKVLVLPNVGRL